MPVLTTADEVSDIAFGFMGSKALFAALHVDLFSHLSDSPLSLDEAAGATGLAPERARTLLTALTSLGLVSEEEGRFANAPAADAFLVKGARYDFSDYLRHQVDRQMYRLMDQIVPALENRLPPGAIASYRDWFSDPEQARLYSESQHAGSLGPARSLARDLDLTTARRMLDVGGGTGAFSITLCAANPALSATIIDFPNVATVGRERIAEAGLEHRIAYAGEDALDGAWPGEQDVVLMSYLFSGVPDHAHDGLLANAYGALVPGGRVLVHDFILSEDRQGPRNTALWQLQHTAFTPKARSLDAAWLSAALDRAGFSAIRCREMIPGMTMLVEAERP